MKENISEYVIDLIEDHQIIGLGGGSTVAQIAAALSKQHTKKIQVVALSDATQHVCQELGLDLIDFQEVEEIDWTFDGCDLVDKNFHGLKTKGGIQTQEKLLAQLSKHYVLLATPEKYQANLAFTLPICCEVLPDALPVIKKLMAKHGVSGKLRTKDQHREITKLGNYLIDISWHQEDSVTEIAQILDSTIGIISHSLFLTEVTDVLMNDTKNNRVSRLSSIK